MAMKPIVSDAIDRATSETITEYFTVIYASSRGAKVM